MHRRSLIVGGAALALSGCQSTTGQGTNARLSTRAYTGPRVTRIVVMKGKRRLYLMSGDEVLKTYRIGLGFSPKGDKKVVGDGKTPEGRYIIDRRNPQSEFYLSIGISYPNSRDRAEAAALGRSPGGDIFIHGQAPRKYGVPTRRDWTAGCIAVQNHEMREIYNMVGNGTVIDIYA
nr:L,D-transpeptidase family protein [Actibacterium pelagium]